MSRVSKVLSKRVLCHELRLCRTPRPKGLQETDKAVTHVGQVQKERRSSPLEPE